MPRLNTVHDVQTSDLSGDAYSSFYLASYGKSVSGSSYVITPQDGAAGLFVRATCNGKPDDGGAVLHDANGLCFFRQNLNGDLRQWGITQGSNFDVIYNLQHGTVGAIDNAAPRIFLAMQGLAAVGITRMHTHQVSIKIGLNNNVPLVLLKGTSLTCDTAAVKNAANADYTQLPGSLIIAHGSSEQANFIDANTNNDVEVYGCAAIIPEWYINPGIANTQFGGYSFNMPLASYSDLEAIRANMILAGDIAIEAGAGAKIHDLSILGFDNCIHSANGPGTLIKNIAMDCSIGLYMSHNLGAATIKDIDANPRLTKQAGNPQIENEEYWTITGIGKDANGQCQLSLQAVQGDSAGGGLYKPKYSVADLTDSKLGSDLGDRDDPISYPAWVTGRNTRNHTVPRRHGFR